MDNFAKIGSDMQDLDKQSEEEKRTRKYGLPRYRKQVIEKLNNALKNDLLEFEDYEERIDLANKANSIEELNEVLYDFPERKREEESTAGKRGAGDNSANYRDFKSAYKKRDEDTLVNIFSSSHFSGTDLPENRLQTVNILGSSKIDLSEKNNTAKVFEINVFNLLGETTLIVPDNVKVRSEVISILGETKKFNYYNGSDVEPEKLVIIKGFSILGEVRIRRPGEGMFNDIHFKMDRMRRRAERFRNRRFWE